MQYSTDLFTVGRVVVCGSVHRYARLFIIFKMIYADGLQIQLQMFPEDIVFFLRRLQCEHESSLIHEFSD